jgi:hypothetical protein
MGAGYSVSDGNPNINEERMKSIYSAYCKPGAYDIWKTQLENAAKSREPAKVSTIRNASTVIQ